MSGTVAKSKKTIVDEIKMDKELRHYFIDYLGENLKMTFVSFLELDQIHGKKFITYADKKLSILTAELERKVPKKHVQFVLTEVCSFYAGLSVVAVKNDSRPCFFFPDLNDSLN